MALIVAQSGGRPNFLPGVIRAGVKLGPAYKRADKVLTLLQLLELDMFLENE